MCVYLFVFLYLQPRRYCHEQHGAVSTLVSLLNSPSSEVVEQAMWVLGNMAQEEQDGTAARDAVLQAGALG